MKTITIEIVTNFNSNYLRNDYVEEGVVVALEPKKILAYIAPPVVKVKEFFAFVSLVTFVTIKEIKGIKLNVAKDLSHCYKSFHPP